MKTLSVIQPWATLICSGIKDVENRTWAPPMNAIGQKLLIHASGKRFNPAVFADIPFEWLSEITNAIKYGWIPDPDEIQSGVILGYVDLVGYAQKTNSLWDQGEEFTKWIMENAYMFDEPIPAKGRLGVFETPMDVLPPAHKVITVVPHREGDVLVLPYSDKFVDQIFEDKTFDLDLTDENVTLLAEMKDDDYIPAVFKKVRFVTPTRTLEFPVADAEIYVDSYVDTGEPIFYKSLRGEDYGKYKIAFYSEKVFADSNYMS